MTPAPTGDTSTTGGTSGSSLQRWLELAYGDDAVITQVDDGCPSKPGMGGSMPTSSASSPIIVAIMLGALDVQPGNRVCEIGAGTGYNAALLAPRRGGR